MSETAAPGPGATDQSQPANPIPAQAQPDNGPADVPANALSGLLSEANRPIAESKGWKDVADIDKIVSSYAEVEKLRGQSARVPAEDAPQEEWDEYLSRVPPTMRAPEKPENYEFRLPEGLPENLPYDNDLAAKSKDWMHKAKLNPSQAQEVHNGFLSYAAEQHQAAIAQAEASIEETHDALVKDWGPEDSDAFKEHYLVANRALKNLGLEELFTEKGILIPDPGNKPMLADAQLAKALYAIGDKMYRDDQIETGRDAPSGKNPFMAGPDGKHDTDAISAAIKNDRQRAMQLCKDAGEPTTRWFGTGKRR